MNEHKILCSQLINFVNYRSVESFDDLDTQVADFLKEVEGEMKEVEGETSETEIIKSLMEDSLPKFLQDAEDDLAGDDCAEMSKEVMCEEIKKLRKQKRLAFKYCVLQNKVKSVIRSPQKRRTLTSFFENRR
jgi:hypothetical protein